MLFKTRKKERVENLSNNAIITQNASGICSPARETGNFGGFLRHHAQTLGDWEKYGSGCV